MDLFERKSSSSSKSKNSPSIHLMHQPLATRMRPNDLDEFVGQEHIVGDDKMLRRMIESGHIGSIILYGPPSSGKTTLAHVISRETEAHFEQLNAVLDGVKELREVVKQATQRERFNHQSTILFVDEIHRWNKSQQDALLPHIESGIIRLIGATTENPFYSLVNPLLSRCQLFELHPLEVNDVKIMLKRAVADTERGLANDNVILDEDALEHLSSYASGDVRNALNALEMAVKTTPKEKDGKVKITLDVAKECIQKRVVRFAKNGDEHYHYASAFIKSLRGSDVDGALYWMCAMLESGEDPTFIFRRLLIQASEDVGMAEPFALTMVNAAFDAFERCGMPEGFYFLAHATIYLCLCPKSHSVGTVFAVKAEIDANGIGSVPPHLRDKTANAKASRYLDIKNASDDYKYPHNYPNHWVEQQYLPQEIAQKRWYQAEIMGREAQLNQRLEQIKINLGSK